MTHESSQTGLAQYPLWTDRTDEESILRQAAKILENRLVKGEAFSSPDAVKEYCQYQIAADVDECFCCLFLTSQHQLIRFERLFRGTIDSASVYPRVVVRRALELNAAAVIFTHNHPSGISEPSRADYHITEKLKDALALVDIRVLDHIVVGTGSAFSIAEAGRL